MTQFDAKVSQLVNQNTTGKHRVFVRTFNLTPPGGITGRTGSLFGLIEIHSANLETPDLIDLIIEELQDNFYYPKNLKPDQSFSNINEQFEIALKNVNLSIAAFLETRHITLDLEKINIILGLSADKDLHFTVIGNVGAMLFFHVAKNNYKIINILDNSGTTEVTPNPLKMFSQVISGKISPRDILFISTANIFDYFSLESIKNIITNDLPSKGIRQLNHSLESINSKESFGALALELEKKPETAEPKVKTLSSFDYSKAASQDSIKELIKTENETAKLLSPSLMPEIKKYASSFKTALKNYSEKIKSGNESLYQKQKIVIKRPNLPQFPKSKISLPNLQLKNRLQQVVQKSNDSLKKLPLPATSQVKQVKNAFASAGKNPLIKKISEICRRLINLVLKKFSQLPSSSKLLLVAGLVLLLIFSYSIVWLGIKNSRDQRIAEANQIITDVENKVNEAEASLIFRDENLARNLLVEAREQLKQVKSQTDDQALKITQVTIEIENQLAELRHIVDMIEPIQIINFQNIDGQAEIASLALLRRNTAYTQNKNNLSIYKGNLDTRILGSILAPEANTGKFVLGTVLNDNELLFFNENKNAFLLNPNNDSLQSVSIGLPENSTVIDATNYNNRLYLLDTASSQIYRYSRVAGGFSAGQGWVTQSGINLTDAVSIIVDGSLYLLRANGEIIKFQNGQLVDFKVATIDPPLVAPTKLRTSENSNFLYILDPAGKRVVVLDKNGNLIQQYYSNKFDNLKDMLIMETTKQIFVLNGSVIFGIAAQHL